MLLWVTVSIGIMPAGEHKQVEIPCVIQAVILRTGFMKLNRNFKNISACDNVIGKFLGQMQLFMRRIIIHSQHGTMSLVCALIHYSEVCGPWI
jgi:hypothetical protein